MYGLRQICMSKWVTDTGYGCLWQVLGINSGYWERRKFCQWSTYKIISRFIQSTIFAFVRETLLPDACPPRFNEQKDREVIYEDCSHQCQWTTTTTYQPPLPTGPLPPLPTEETPPCGKNDFDLKRRRIVGGTDALWLIADDLRHSPFFWILIMHVYGTGGHSNQIAMLARGCNEKHENNIGKTSAFSLELDNQKFSKKWSWFGSVVR